MGRDDYDDDDDRPRRRRRRDYDDDYDDIGRGGRETSGSVTAVGVISIIMGSLTLLCGLCMTIGSFTFFAAGPRGNFGGNPNLPPMLQWLGGAMIVVAILIVIFGVLYMVGGIGVLQRRTWGRIMTLVMGGFSILFGVLQLVGVIVTLAAPAPMEAKLIQALINLLVMAVFFTHGIMSFVVLLSGKNVAEFE